MSLRRRCGCHTLLLWGFVLAAAPGSAASAPGLAAPSPALAAPSPALAAPELSPQAPLIQAETARPAPRQTAHPAGVGCAAAREIRPAGPTILQPQPQPALLDPSPSPGLLPGYADALSPTPLGWPRLDRWCVWIEPPSAAADPWQRRWWLAVSAALDSWSALLAVQRVDDPAAAQLRVWRRTPPLGRTAAGRPRASHGRAHLALVAAQRGPAGWRLEPSVEVLIGPGQRAEALQATALHELGHAFGLWGHSPDPADALAAVPGAVPVLQPSARDRATLRWLQAQPSPFGGPVAEPAAAAAAAPAAAR